MRPEQIGHRFNFSFGPHYVLDKVEGIEGLSAHWMRGTRTCSKCGHVEDDVSPHLIQDALVCVPKKQWERLKNEQGPPGVKDTVIVIVYTSDNKVLRVDGSILNHAEVTTKVLEKSDLYKRLI